MKLKSNEVSQQEIAQLNKTIKEKVYINKLY